MYVQLQKIHAIDSQLHEESLEEERGGTVFAAGGSWGCVNTKIKVSSGIKIDNNLSLSDSFGKEHNSGQGLLVNTEVKYPVYFSIESKMEANQLWGNIQCASSEIN